jgi:TPP-dependent trihydroxycyclohexane-1,2-dione (THcHDO) dehydratase
MIDDATTVAIFGGDGCGDARDAVIQLAGRLKAPVGYTFRGKQWLEHDNPNAVGMTGLLGYGGAYGAIHDADLLLLLGTVCGQDGPAGEIRFECSYLRVVPCLSKQRMCLPHPDGVQLGLIRPSRRRE